MATVKELIEKLSKLDGNQRVMVENYDGWISEYNTDLPLLVPIITAKDGVEFWCGEARKPKDTEQPDEIVVMIGGLSYLHSE